MCRCMGRCTCTRGGPPVTALTTALPKALACLTGLPGRAFPATGDEVGGFGGGLMEAEHPLGCGREEPRGGVREKQELGTRGRGLRQCRQASMRKTTAACGSREKWAARMTVTSSSGPVPRSDHRRTGGRPTGPDGPPGVRPVGPRGRCMRFPTRQAWGTSPGSGRSAAGVRHQRLA
ncbi:hypothetical protein SAFG77S_06184 [Streptomyces afghaniensis]